MRAKKYPRKPAPAQLLCSLSFPIHHSKFSWKCLIFSSKKHELFRLCVVYFFGWPTDNIYQRYELLVQFFFLRCLAAKNISLLTNFAIDISNFCLYSNFLFPNLLFSSSVFWPHSNSVYNSPKCFSGGTEKRSKFPKNQKATFFTSLSIITILFVNHQKIMLLFHLKLRSLLPNSR